MVTNEQRTSEDILFVKGSLASRFDLSLGNAQGNVQAVMRC